MSGVIGVTKSKKDLDKLDQEMEQIQQKEYAKELRTEGCAKIMAIELRPHGIVVNIVHPPLTRTHSSASLGVPARFMADPKSRSDSRILFCGNPSVNSYSFGLQKVCEVRISHKPGLKEKAKGAGP